MISKTELIGLKNREAIAQEIGKLDTINYETVSELLPKLLESGSLNFDHSVYKPVDPSSAQAKGRYLVYNHPDKTNPFSIWIFAFAPRQKTSIHDHKYKGTVTVLEGPITEKFYRPVGETTAKLVDRINRHRFHTNKDNLNSVFVHQLKRGKSLGLGESITLHIYNMDAYFINQQGKQDERRNLSQIYTKVKSLDETPEKDNKTWVPTLG